VTTRTSGESTLRLKQIKSMMKDNKMMKDDKAMEKKP